MFEQAAAYLFHLAQSHPFIDGDKRAALAIALLFLGLHGVEIEAPDDALYALVSRVATGTAPKSEIACASMSTLFEARGA